MESRGKRADTLRELEKGLEGSGLESGDLKQQAEYHRDGHSLNTNCDEPIT